MLMAYLEGNIEKIIAIVIVIAIIFIGVATYKEAQIWAEFSAENNCRVVAYEKSSIATAINTDGNFTTITIPSKTTYLCDDGVTYVR